MQKLLRMPGVASTVADQCMFNNLTTDDNGEYALCKKSTRFVTNSRYMIEELSRKCSRDHVHVQLEGGRACMAGIYPLELLKAILAGVSRTKDAIDALQSQQVKDYEAVLSLATAEAELQDPSDASTQPLPHTSIPIRDGGEFRMQFKIEKFKKLYKDEYTGEQLPSHLVHKAMCEELE